MIQEISNCCKNIIETLQNNEQTIDIGKENFQNRVNQLQDFLKEFDFWFKTQMNSEELLINYIYTQLLKVREINKEIQSKPISEKSSEIKGISLDSNTSDGSQTEGSSVMTKFKQVSKKLMKKSENLLELINQNQQEQIGKLNLITPQRSYTLDKIYYIITFEIRCLNQFDISEEKEQQLEIILNQPELRWIFELIQAKNAYKQTLSCLVKYAQEMLTFEFDDFNQEIEKLNNYLSNDGSLNDYISNRSFQINQDHFKQLLVDKIKQSMSEKDRKRQQLKMKMIKKQGEGDSKVCMCQIF